MFHCSAINDAFNEPCAILKHYKNYSQENTWDSHALMQFNRRNKLEVKICKCNLNFDNIIYAYQ